MAHIGFSVEKLYGSAWHFSLKEGGEDKAVQFHESHSIRKLALWMARRYGRRLTARYGWTGETDVLA